MSKPLLEQGNEALAKLPENYLPFIVRWLELLADNNETENEDFWLLISKALKREESEPSKDWKTQLRAMFPEQVGTWEEIRKLYPNVWLVVEALDGKTVNNMRQIDTLHVCGVHDDNWNAAWQQYKTLHRASKYRELYVLHTQREEMDIEVVHRF